MNKEIKKIAEISLFSALAIIFNVVESFFISPMQFGIRLGIANIISLIAIKKMKSKDILLINLLRVLLTSILKGNFLSSTFFISLMGVLLSIMIIICCDKVNTSILFMSVMSAIFHSLGQFIVIFFIYNTINIINILPILIIISVLTGILTGLIAKLILKRIKI